MRRRCVSHSPKSQLRPSAISALLALSVISLSVLIACGGRPNPPPRAVYEKDVDGWSFRRYQALLDVEVWVPKNRAAAHTASYVHKEGLKRGRLGEDDVVNVVVTRYKKDAGILRALVKFVRRLSQESGYRVEEEKIGGVRVLSVSGSGETWAIWASKRHIIKVGGRGRDGVPKSIIKAYGKPYPSRVKGGVLDGPLPPGPDYKPEAEKSEPFDEDNPEPEWDKDKRESETKKKKKKKRKKKKKKRKKKKDDEDES